mmetsp:Transcript_1469/g.3532  ORF Transcript_1469/g.3532 Transcript_1469/m.3532 type:complete len:589 (+) Transcript_1469:609-2375(+)
MRSVLLVEAVLPLHDHAKVLVVQNHHLHGKLLHAHGGELLAVHHEAAVAVKVNHGHAVRQAHVLKRRLRSKRRRQTESHRAETSRRKPLPRRVELVVLRREHLVLPDSRGHHGVAVRRLPHLLDCPLGINLLLLRLRVLHGEILLLLGDIFSPVAIAAAIRFRSLTLEVLEVGVEHLVHQTQRLANLGAYRHVRVLVLADLRRVDVDVHNRRAIRKRLELAGDAVVEAHAERQQQISLIDGVVGVHGAVHAKHAEAEFFVGEGIRTQAHESLHDGNAERLGELRHLSPAVDAPSTNVHHRRLCLLDSVEDRLGVRARRRRGLPPEVAAQLQRHVPRRHGHRLLDVLRDVDEHGTRASGACKEERLSDDARDVLDAHDEVVVLGDGPADFDDRRFLERVRSNHAAWHLPCDGNHGHAVEHGIGEPGDEVGCPRSGGGDAHADVSGCFGVPFGGEHLPLLVTAQDVSYGVAARERLVDFHRRASRVSEERVNTLPFERLNEHVASLSRRVTEPVRPRRGCGRVVRHLVRGQVVGPVDGHERKFTCRRPRRVHILRLNPSGGGGGGRRLTAGRQAAPPRRRTSSTRGTRST